MDYAFAPGGTPYDRQLLRLLGRIPNTKVIAKSALAQPTGGPKSFDVAAFRDHLTANAAIAKPIGDILIATHGGASGFMSIDLDRVSKDLAGNNAKNTTYEVLVQAVASKSVEIPAALHANPAPNPATPFDIHIRGCRVGQAPEFVKKLSQAFVRPRSVTAPKFLHVAAQIGLPHGKSRKLVDAGSIEYLAYAFELSRIKNSKGAAHDPKVHHLKTRAEAIAQFHAAGFAFIDKIVSGTTTAQPVPQKLWKSWIRKLSTHQHLRRIRPGVQLGAKVGLRLPHYFRVKDRQWPITVNAPTDPGTAAQREAFLRQKIKAHALFQAGHKFPLHKRLGFATVDAFLDGHNWGCTWKNSQLVCVGRRREYRVSVPVLDPASHADYPKQHLFFNLFPKSGSALNQISRLKRTEARLFLTATP